jgi:hypothetical protein
MSMSRKDYRGIAKAIGKSFDNSTGQLSWALLSAYLGAYLEADNERFDSEKFTDEVDHQHSLSLGYPNSWKIIR